MRITCLETARIPGGPQRGLTEPEPAASPPQLQEDLEGNHINLNALKEYLERISERSRAG